MAEERGAAGRQAAAAQVERAVIVDGLRTPFARQLTAFHDVDGVELGRMVVNELLTRGAVARPLIERVVFGQVVAMPEAPNVAREVMLGAGMAPATDAYSVSRACATSLQSTADLAAAIGRGEISTGIAGGSDSTSVLPIQVSRRLASTLVGAGRAKTLRERLRLFSRVRPRDLQPRPPAIRDYTTGLGMGEIGEQMAKSHGITRREQDDFALRSHQRAHAAWEAGKLDDWVMHAFAGAEQRPLRRDNNIRPDASLADLQRLKPAFDRRHGSVTPGNATPLTDGAAALMLMAESRARELGLEPLGAVRSWAFRAVDPFHDGLMGPSYATPAALEQAGLTLADMALVEIHEAFASQTLANLKYWPDPAFAREYLGRTEPIGEVDWERLNVNGGSIAYGHPFAATGARMILHTLAELRQRGGGYGLVTACAAGGLGGAMVLEAA